MKHNVFLSSEEKTGNSLTVKISTLGFKVKEV